VNTKEGRGVEGLNSWLPSSHSPSTVYLLQHNKITHLSGLKQCGNLQSISLGKNLVASAKGYQKMILLHLPRLVYLDNVKVSKDVDKSEGLKSNGAQDGKCEIVTIIEELEIELNSDPDLSEEVGYVSTELLGVLSGCKKDTDRTLQDIELHLHNMKNRVGEMVHRHLEDVDIINDRTGVDAMEIEIGLPKYAIGIIEAAKETIAMDMDNLLAGHEVTIQRCRELCEKVDMEESSKVLPVTLDKQITGALETTWKRNKRRIESEIVLCKEEVFRQHRRRIQQISNII